MTGSKYCVKFYSIATTYIYLSASMYASFYNLLLHFHEVYGASEAKITRKVTKYQRESCIVLLQSDIVWYYIVVLCSHVSLRTRAT